jgi:hypothetical protein
VVLRETLFLLRVDELKPSAWDQRWNDRARYAFPRAIILEMCSNPYRVVADVG